MCESEVVLFVFAPGSNWDNVVDFEHVSMKFKVDAFLAEETDLTLPIQEALFQLATLSWFQLGKKQ